MAFGSGYVLLRRIPGQACFFSGVGGAVWVLLWVFPSKLFCFHFFILGKKPTRLHNIDKHRCPQNMSVFLFFVLFFFFSLNEALALRAARCFETTDLHVEIVGFLYLPKAFEELTQSKMINRSMSHKNLSVREPVSQYDEWRSKGIELPIDVCFVCFSAPLLCPTG